MPSPARATSISAAEVLHIIVTGGLTTGVSGDVFSGQGSKPARTGKSVVQAGMVDQIVRNFGYAGRFQIAR